jgi:hypothetical protein
MFIQTNANNVSPGLQSEQLTLNYQPKFLHNNAKSLSPGVQSESESESVQLTRNHQHPTAPNGQSNHDAAEHVCYPITYSLGVPPQVEFIHNSHGNDFESVHSNDAHAHAHANFNYPHQGNVVL